MKLTTVSENVSILAVFPSPSPSWIPLMEKYGNGFIAMLKNLNCLPANYLSHSKTSFLTFKLLLLDQSYLSNSIYFYTLAQTLWLNFSKPFRYCHTLLGALPTYSLKQMSPIFSAKKKKKSLSLLFKLKLSICFSELLLVQTVEPHSKWQIP